MSTQRTTVEAWEAASIADKFMFLEENGYDTDLRESAWDALPEDVQLTFSLSFEEGGGAFDGEGEGEGVEIEEPSATPEYDPMGQVAPLDPNAPQSPNAPNGPVGPDGAPAKKKYAARLEAMGRAAVGVELPLELHQMMLAAAKADKDIAISAWVRKTWAIAVNALDLTKDDPTDTDPGPKGPRQIPWKFDISQLEEKAARASSTRGLSDEEKAKKKEVVKAAQKDQRALVAQLLAEHKAKLASAAGKA